MSTMICVYSDKYVSKDQFFSFLKSIGGNKQVVSGLEQGNMEDADATIWLYYRSIIELDNKERLDLEELIDEVGLVIAIEISSSEGSDILAKDFCQKLSSISGKLVISNNYGDYFEISNIDKALFIE